MLSLRTIVSRVGVRALAQTAAVSTSAQRIAGRFLAVFLLSIGVALAVGIFGEIGKSCTNEIGVFGFQPS
jgi:hypothetical protein